MKREDIVKKLKRIKNELIYKCAEDDDNYKAYLYVEEEHLNELLDANDKLKETIFSAVNDSGCSYEEIIEILEEEIRDIKIIISNHNG